MIKVIYKFLDDCFYFPQLQGQVFYQLHHIFTSQVPYISFVDLDHIQKVIMIWMNYICIAVYATKSRWSGGCIAYMV